MFHSNARWRQVANSRNGHYFFETCESITRPKFPLTSLEPNFDHPRNVLSGSFSLKYNHVPLKDQDFLSNALLDDVLIVQTSAHDRPERSITQRGLLQSRDSVNMSYMRVLPSYCFMVKFFLKSRRNRL